MTAVLSRQEPSTTTGQGAGGGAKVAMTAQGPLDPELLGVAVVAGLPGLARGQVGIEWI